ncbi:MAG TPA: ASCH domain-containing protein [Methylibium sp.]
MQPLPSVSAILERLITRGLQLPPGRVLVGRYGDSPELSAKLLAHIREGRKRAGASLLWAWEAENESVPGVGDIEVVVDHQNEPVIVTRIAQVDVLPYGAVSAEYAAIEGEGDSSLRYWREAHWAFFSRECTRLGYEPSENMPVVCCVFEVLHVSTAAN